MNNVTTCCRCGSQFTRTPDNPYVVKMAPDICPITGQHPMLPANENHIACANCWQLCGNCQIAITDEVS